MKPDTKVERGRRPVHLETTRLKPAPRAVSTEDREQEVRLAIFTVACAKVEAAALLEGLAGNGRLRARETARKLSAMDSSSRQARLACTFAVRDDASRQLRELFSGASPLLQRQMHRQLPHYLRTTFPALSNAVTQPIELPSKGMTVLAERLVREATR